MKYRRVVISRRGGPEVLRVVEEDMPEPRPGEVRVKIQAAGVAFVDLLIRGGFFPGSPRIPFTPGFDLVGVVDRVGPGVAAFSPGDSVAALPKSGGYAEYACLSAESLVPVPPGMDPAEVVCLVLNYTTAYQLLHRAAKVRAGNRILIHGAGGGIGTALLQLGGLVGLEMYGTASRGKHDLVSRLGGIPIDYRSEDFVARVLALTGDGVDAVFDPVGGSHWRRSYRVLRRGGRLVPYGASALLKEGKLGVGIGFLSLFFLKAIPDGRHVAWMFGITARPYSSPELCRRDLKTLLNLLKEGKIAPVIAERIPLEEASRAHELMERSAVSGKIVLLCNS